MTKRQLSSKFLCPSGSIVKSPGLSAVMICTEKCMKFHMRDDRMVVKDGSFHQHVAETSGARNDLG